MAKTNEVSLSELDDFLDDAAAGADRLKEFVERKTKQQAPKKGNVFGGANFDIDFEVKTTKRDKPANTLLLSNLSNALNTVQASNDCNSKKKLSPVYTARPSHENLPPRAASVSPKIHRSPGHSIRNCRSGSVNRSDSLRRVAMSRRSRSTGRRRLLTEFDNLVNVTRSNSSPGSFLPGVASTPYQAKSAPAAPEPNKTETIKQTQQTEPLNQSTGPNYIPLSQLKAQIAAEVKETCDQSEAKVFKALNQIASAQRPLSRQSSQSSIRRSFTQRPATTRSDHYATYTVQKGAKPGDLLLTPEKVPSLPSAPKTFNVRQARVQLVDVSRLIQKDDIVVPNTPPPVEIKNEPEVYIPETQPQNFPECLVNSIAQKVGNNTLVIPVTCGGHTPIKETHNITQCSKANQTLPEPSLVHHCTNKSIQTTDVHNKQNDLITDDESDDNNNTNNKLQPPRRLRSLRQYNDSTAPLNLATLNDDAIQDTRILRRNTRAATVNTSTGLLNLHKSAIGRKRMKGPLPLNKAPNAPINGEEFARELARMSNYEILDLRKRNSQGMVYPLNGHKKDNKQQIIAMKEQQIQLEQTLSWEILRRNLNGNGEGLPSVVGADPMREHMIENDDLMPAPPAEFEDNSIQNRSLRKRRQDQNERQHHVRPRSRRRDPPVTQELENYMALSETLRERCSKPNAKVRALYNKGSSINGDDDMATPPKRARQTVVEIVQPPPSDTFTDQDEEFMAHIDIVPPPTPTSRYSQFAAREHQTPTRYLEHSEQNEHEEEERAAQLPSPPQGFKRSTNTNVSYVNVEVEASLHTHQQEQPLQEVFRPAAAPSPQPRSLPLESDEQSPQAVGKNTNENKNVTNAEKRGCSLRRRTLLESEIEELIVQSDMPEARSPVLETSTAPVLLIMDNEQPSTSRAARELLRRSQQQTNSPQATEKPPAKSNNKSTNHDNSDTVFKKPMNPAPRTKRKRNIAQRELSNLKMISVEMQPSETQNTLNADTSLRRSRRGRVPLQCTWSHSVDPRQFAFMRDPFDTSTSNVKRATKAAPKPRKPNKKVKENTQNNLPLMPPLCSSTPIGNRPSGSPKKTALAKGGKKPDDNRDRQQEEHQEAFSGLGDTDTMMTDIHPLPDIIEVEEEERTNLTNKKQHENPQPEEMMPVDDPTPMLTVQPPQTQATPQTATGPKKRTRKKKQPKTLPPAEKAPIQNLSPKVNSESVQAEIGSQTIVNEDPNGALLMAWFRGDDIAQYTSQCTNTEESQLKSMEIARVGNLSFAQIDDVAYAFYDTKDRFSVGYMRFQPLQFRRRKRAKSYNLHFIVYSGVFEVECELPGSAEIEKINLSSGDMVLVNTGTRYSLRNLSNAISVLIIFRK